MSSRYPFGPTKADREIDEDIENYKRKQKAAELLAQVAVQCGYTDTKEAIVFLTKEYPAFRELPEEIKASFGIYLICAGVNLEEKRVGESPAIIRQRCAEVAINRGLREKAEAIEYLEKTDDEFRALSSKEKESFGVDLCIAANDKILQELAAKKK
jgi:hypothetical protein